MSLSALIIILFIVALAIVVSIILAVLSEQKNTSGKNTQSVDVDLRKQAQERSNTIISEASEKARSLLVNAELTGIKEVAKSKHDTKELEEAFEAHLESLMSSSANHIEDTTHKIEQHYIDLFKKTEQSVEMQIKDNQQRIVNQLDLLTKEAEKLIATQSEAARKEVAQRMDKELNLVKEHISDYKKRRMEAIDTRIVDLVSETVKRILGKTLSKKDHADLVYKALNEAKKDGFFA